MHRNTKEGDVPPTHLVDWGQVRTVHGTHLCRELWGRTPISKALCGGHCGEGRTAIGVPANAYTLYIYFTNGNRSVTADFSWKSLNFIKKILDFIKLSHNFRVFSKNIFKFNQINVKTLQHIFIIFSKITLTRLLYILWKTKIFSKVCQIS